MIKTHVVNTLDTTHLGTPDPCRQLGQFLALIVRQFDYLDLLSHVGVPHVQLLHDHADRLQILRASSDNKQVAGFIRGNAHASLFPPTVILRDEGLVDDIGDRLGIRRLYFKNPVARRLASGGIQLLHQTIDLVNLFLATGNNDSVRVFINRNSCARLIVVPVPILHQCGEQFLHQRPDLGCLSGS